MTRFNSYTGIIHDKGFVIVSFQMGLMLAGLASLLFDISVFKSIITGISCGVLLYIIQSFALFFCKKFLSTYESALIQFMKFVTVGALNMILMLLLLNILISLFNLTNPLYISIAFACAYVVSIAQGFFWMYLWIFTTTTKSKKLLKFSHYGIISILNLLFISFGSTYLLGNLRIHTEYGLLIYNIGVLLLAIIALTFNFLYSKLVIFSNSNI